ncbi:MAG: PspA/IM30 family protein [Dehalococcoidia bacterium]|nr:PspA/IM30 family protein [Dehalococcoidia bacterium]
MGLLSRMSMVIQAKLTKILDQSENPSETIEYSYEKQLEMLRKVKQGVVEVVTSRRRLELQANKIQADAAKAEEQARQALNAGREDLAKMALQRKQLAMIQLNDLGPQIGDLEKEQEKLTLAESRLQAKVTAFRTRKEVVKAQYSAAEASVRINEAVTGLSEEMANVDLAMERIEDKTEKMKARAEAIDELAETGLLEDASSRGNDPLARELSRLSANQNVDTELEAMKRQLAAGGERPQLGAGS